MDGIGEPLTVFNQLIYLAIPCNAGLIVWTFGGGKALGDKGYETIAFLALCFLFAVTLNFFDAYFPDVPEKTEIQLERSRHVFDVVIKGMAVVNKKVGVDLLVCKFYIARHSFFF